jgi:uncharacterized protein HemX
VLGEQAVNKKNADTVRARLTQASVEQSRACKVTSSGTLALLMVALLMVALLMTATMFSFGPGLDGD